MSKEKIAYKDNDQLLVAAAKKDREAFAAIYDKYFEKMYLFIYKRVCDEAIAGDICQETMLKVMFNINKYEDRSSTENRRDDYQLFHRFTDHSNGQPLTRPSAKRLTAVNRSMLLRH